MFPLTDPILVFAILVLVIMAAPLLAGRLRVPDLVLLLVAGALLGPNGLGVLKRDSAVVMFGSVGLLYIMFLAGLEIDLHRFSQTKRRTVSFGLLTFAIPQVLGTLAGRYVLGMSWASSMLLASMFASHTLLAYPLASRLGISRSEPVGITVGATIVTDTLALLVLAVIAGSARGEGLGVGFWLGIGIGMSVLVALIWLGVPRLARWFFQNVTETGGAQFLFVLVTLCVFSYLSHFAKLEPIIGAFLVGAAFNRLIPERSVLMNRVSFVGNNLFIPFFLISVGMLVDSSALIHSPRSWLVAATMVVMVVVTKYAAAWIAGRCFGYDRDARRVMFGLSVVQAAATLAAVLIGYDLDVFDATVLNGTIGMIMVTCPLGSWMVDRYGRKMASRTVQEDHGGRRQQRLLVPVANPVAAKKVLDLAFLLRDTSAPGDINPVTIVREDADLEAAVTKGEKLLAHCLTHAASADIPVNPSVRVDMNVSDGIVRAAKELRSSMVLAGWTRGPSIRARFFGTLTENLLNACPARLLFCRLNYPLNNMQRIIVWFSPLAEKRRDITQLTRDIKFVAHQIGAQVRVYLSDSNTDVMKRIVETTRPSCPLTFVDSPSAADARNKLFDDIHADDLLLVPGERPNGVLWTPTVDKLPELLASRFPENNLLVAYPALAEEDGLVMLQAEPQPGETFALHPVDVEADADLPEALARMTTSAFPVRAELADHARRLLLESAETYPVEISPGVVLLHAHCDTLEHPTLIVGRGRRPWEFPGLRVSSQILLALLSPQDQSPNVHLKSLSELARSFRDPAFAQQVVAATSAQDICRLLGRRTG